MRAFTLAELLVAVAVLVLVAGAALGFFFPSLRDSTRTQVRMDLQRAAVDASYKLIADLEICTPSGVGLAETMVGLQPVIDITAEVPPAPVYDSKLTLYWWDAPHHTLQRWTGLPTGFVLSSSVPHRCTLDEMKDLVSKASKSTCVCRDVTAFQLSSTALPPAVGLPLKLHLVVERPAAAGYPPERYQIERTVSLRMAE